MKKIDTDELVMPGCLLAWIGIAAFFCWFIYKVAAGTYHLIDKVI